MANKYPTAKELRALPETDLKEQIETLRQELWRHRVNAKAGSLQHTHLLPMAKRQIARLQTIQREQS